eukprot:gnl/MRDRNA2_/MRDRNA2_382641_c0_seq1.p1 gnl/MRDRNA2_/MRDRNA2_382641_c0~~gnl/MRDRNA2_/MRDRNA2_382641_c0_seq1.p1  ORF type:complete len:272 (-),score=31.78 gnl/MRDRNA2_/MRDRNA2_382641_c0_seq1:19-744(-)
MLGEKVPAVFPVQALLAVAGMCFILQPPLLLSAFGLAPASVSRGGNYTLVVGAMIVSAIVPIVTRQTKEASWIEMEHVTSFLAVFILNPIIFCVKHAVKGEPLSPLTDVSAWEVGIIVLASFGSFAAVAMQTRGYQMADPGKAGMFNYLEIPFAYLLQLLDTHNPISTNSIIGAVLVLLACLLGAIAQLQISRAASLEVAIISNTEAGEIPAEWTQCEQTQQRSVALKPMDSPLPSIAHCN